MTVGLDLPDLLVDRIRIDGDLLLITAHTQFDKDRCPECDGLSTRIHSRYSRTLQDLAWQGRTVRLQLVCKRFFCTNKACPRKIFTQRLPLLAKPYARTTQRLELIHSLLGWALGGNPAARLAQRLGVPISADSLIRRVKANMLQPKASPRIVGVDDWAWRKGRRYGTIVVDHERGEVIELLPDRDSDTLQKWLKQHPQIEIVTRDRSGSYTQATTQAAPQATQIADRWHLLKNVREALERVFQRHATAIRKRFQATSRPAETEVQPGQQATSVSSEDARSPPKEVTAARQRREERFERVRLAYREGKSIRQITKELGMGRGTVRRYLRQEHCPDWLGRKPVRSRLDSYRQQIDKRIAEGCTSVVTVHSSLVEQGCCASYDATRRYLNKRLAVAGVQRPRGKAAGVSVPECPSASQLSFAVIRREENRSEKEREHLRRVIEEGLEWSEAVELVNRIATMIRKQSDEKLDAWLESAEKSRSVEMQELAKSLRQDRAAVEQAMTSRWSNGPVEGQVNRLKSIKRQMYGRAGIELLRARVCPPQDT